MNSHINTPANDSVANLTEATPASATKPVYTAPQLTIHGQLEQVTQQTSNNVGNPPPGDEI